jgi:putative membrane protein
MQGFVIRVLMNVVGLWLATVLIPGITANTTAALVWAAISLGLVNAFIRPLVVFLTLPFTLLTLGLFLLFINAAMLNLAAWFVEGFDVVGVIDAVLGAILVGIVSWAGSAFVGDNGKYRVLVVERRSDL